MNAAHVARVQDSKPYKIRKEVRSIFDDIQSIRNRLSAVKDDVIEEDMPHQIEMQSLEACKKITEAELETGRLFNMMVQYARKTGNAI